MLIINHSQNFFWIISNSTQRRLSIFSPFVFVGATNLQFIHSSLSCSSLCWLRAVVLVNLVSHFSQAYPIWTLMRWASTPFSNVDLKSQSKQDTYFLSWVDLCILICLAVWASNSHFLQCNRFLSWNCILGLFNRLSVLLLILHKSHLWTFMSSSKMSCTPFWWITSRDKLANSFPQWVQLASSWNLMCFTRRNHLKSHFLQFSKWVDLCSLNMSFLTRWPQKWQFILILLSIAYAALLQIWYWRKLCTFWGKVFQA